MIRKDREDYNNRAHPALYQWLYDLQEAVDGNNVPNINLTVEKLPQVLASVQKSRARAFKNEAEIGMALDVEWEGAVGSRSEKRAAQILKDLGSHEPQFIFNSIGKEPTIQALHDVFVLLEKIWPQQLEEIKELLDVAVIFRCDKAIGFTDVETNGAIYIKEESIKDPVELAELIVHEASHGDLNMLLATDAMFTNPPEETYMSPLRPDPRPMFGVFHQLFVLMRLRKFYQCVKHVDARYDDQLEKVEVATQAAYKVVNENAKLILKQKL